MRRRRKEDQEENEFRKKMGSEKMRLGRKEDQNILGRKWVQKKWDSSLPRGCFEERVRSR